MNTTLFYYLNISIRVITILMGVFIVSNWLNLPTESNDSVQWIGWVMIAVGSVRLIMYLFKWKDFIKKNQDSDSEKMKKTYNKCILLLLISIMLISCETNDKQSDSTIESPLRGSDTVFCDESIYTCFNNAMPVYQKAFPDAHITLFSKNARSSMTELFSEKTKSIIVARNYLPDEDSLLKQSGNSFQKIHIANDGLVFFVSKDYPIDTINMNQLTDYISGKIRLSMYFQKINSEPMLLIPGAQSSEYANAISFFRNCYVPQKYCKIY